MSDEIARRLVEAYPDVWAAGMLPLEPDGDGGWCSTPRLCSYQPEGMAVPVGAVPALDDDATAGVLVARLGPGWAVWAAPGRCDVFQTNKRDRDGISVNAPTLGRAAALALLALRGGGVTTSAIWTVFYNGEGCVLWCDDARDRSTRQAANAGARAAGWRVIGDRALCPACLRKVQQAAEATPDPSASGYGGTTYRAGLLTFARPRGPE